MRRSWIGLLGCLLSLAVLPIAAVPAQASPKSSLDATLARLLADAGGSSGAKVVDLTTGKLLFSSYAGTPRLPASMEKIYTTSTALTRFGSQGRLTTTILARGKMGTNGTWRGTLYLRGGGDPTFGSASYDHYAYGTGATMQQLVRNLIHSTGIKSFQGQIVADESFFDSLRGTPATGYAASSYVEGELSALIYDRGFTDASGSAFQYHPALFAGQRLRDALSAAGVRLLKGTSVRAGRTPRNSPVVATVQSPKMSTLIQLTNTPSDNFFAEMLVKGIGAHFGAGGNTAAGAGVVRQQVARSFGIHPAVVDGSGLSRSDHTSPRDVVTALTDLAGNQSFVRSLAIGGETGTMQAGLAGTAAQGRCRGKTGTLHDVANLAGYCTARDGHRLVFAFMMNDLSDSNYGHALEYDMAVALAKYNG